MTFSFVITIESCVLLVKMISSISPESSFGSSFGYSREEIT